MRQQLTRLGVWLATRYHTGDIHVVQVPAEYTEHARQVVESVNADVDNASPENKHARAFARMLRRFPGASRRDLALAIELALRKHVP